MPKLHTSLLIVNFRKVIASGAVQRSGSFSPYKAIELKINEHVFTFLFINLQYVYMQCA